MFAADALVRLQQLDLFLSEPLNGRTLELQPKVVQIWFEPSPRQVTGAAAILAPAPVMALHGEQKLSPREIVWSIADERGRATALLRSTGRVMLRVHCGHLVDERERSFSSSVDALVGVRSPHLPAGVFEGWFFVVADGGAVNPSVIAPGRPVVVKRAAKKSAAVPRKRGGRGT
jgi:hypothetical protein